MKYLQNLTSGYSSVYSCDNETEGREVKITDLPDDIVEKIFVYLEIEGRTLNAKSIWFPFRQANLEWHRSICHDADIINVVRGSLTRLHRRYDLDYNDLLRAFWFDLLMGMRRETGLPIDELATALLENYGAATDICIRIPKRGCCYSNLRINDKVWDGTMLDTYNSCKTIHYYKARNHIRLKSHLFFMMLMVPGAFANPLKNVGIIYSTLANKIFQLCLNGVDYIFIILEYGFKILIKILEWSLTPLEKPQSNLQIGTAAESSDLRPMDYFIAAFLFVFLYRLFNNWLNNLKLKPIPLMQTSDDYSNSRIIGEVKDNTGHSFILLHNNEKYLVKKDYECGPQPQDEMALPGSDLYPSAPRPVGAILVSNDNITYQVVGCFFRYDDKLVTARHVATLVSCGIAQVKLSGTIRNKRGNSVLDDSVAFNVDTKFFDDDQNLAGSSAIDLFVKPLEARQWAKLGLNKCGVRVNSKYGLCVSLVGFQNGVLVTSNGKTLKDSGGLDLHYNASTLKGFSGSPVFSGNSVVGMHYQGDISHNSAIRREMITPLIAKPVNEDGFTSSAPSRISMVADVKNFGRPYRDYHGNSRFLRDDGSITSEYSDQEMDEYYELESRANKLAFGDHYDYDDYDYVSKDRKKRNAADWEMSNDKWGDYENAPIRQAAFTELPRIEPKPTTFAACESADVYGYVELPRGKEVHCAPTGVVQDAAIDMLDNFKDEILACGFEEHKYQIPVINKENEVKSLINHMALWKERCGKKQEPPTEKEIFRLLNILEQRINISWEPDAEYDSIEYILDVINTSAIGAKKSSGRPYQADGMATIGDVLKKYGPEQFAEIVLREWRTSMEYKLFLKNEPHKIKKIESEMIRIITCMPVHKLVKNNCIFRNYLAKTSKAWLDNSVMFYGFNPIIPNATEKLRKRFEGKIVHGSDKTNWDFSYFSWIFDIYKQYHCRIVKCPEKWDEERFDKFKQDICETIDEVYKNCTYVTSNGRRFRQVVDGIMKSGWYLTIDANTFGQIVINTLALMRCGFSDEEIIRDFDMVAGGDDDLDSFPPGFDTDLYYKEICKMGIDVAPEKITTGIIGNEFFSNSFELDKDGLVTFHPVRFTKHIYKLRLNKLEDLPQALNSHMQNYCWSKREFRLFEKMYQYILKKYDLPDCGSRSMIFWRYKNKGLEIPISC